MSAEPNALGQIHHVEINVSNLQRAIDFWGWFLGSLGYHESQRWEEGVSYQKGGTYLVFAQTGDRFIVEPYHRCRTGLNHLAFSAESASQVDEFRDVLRSRGVPLLYDDRYPRAGGPDSYAVFFEDPDRIKVELVVQD